MTLKVKYIARLEDTKTGEIIEEQVVQSKSISFAKEFKDFGLRHQQQVELIKNSQDFLLKFQCKTFDENTTCPNCAKKMKKQGMITSDFHDVYTDHQVQIQRLTCSCGLRNNYTLNSIYGSSTHPELVKLQASCGAKQSYAKASKILNEFCCTIRKINNNVTIMRLINQVGGTLEKHKKSAGWCESTLQSDELIVTTDGGHVQNSEEGKHSFEEMISTVFRPEDVIIDANGNKEITQRISVASAKNDKQTCIKTLTLNACKKLGMHKDTIITALTDGANNCWSIVNSLKAHCKEITKVLDWFHIAKKFKEYEFKITDELRPLYDKAKWHLWHGRPSTAIIRLQQVQRSLANKEAGLAINKLIKYIDNNQDAIVNYHMRQNRHLPYSSQLAESSVNSIINERQKNNKMQWTRNGAHNILQIRTSLFSKKWDEDWKAAEEILYRKAA